MTEDGWRGKGISDNIYAQVVQPQQGQAAWADCYGGTTGDQETDAALLELLNTTLTTRTLAWRLVGHCWCHDATTSNSGCSVGFLKTWLVCLN